MVYLLIYKHIYNSRQNNTQTNTCQSLNENFINQKKYILF